MKDNLEHGWLVSGRKEKKGEIVGYCEECCKPIYENENFTKVYGALICECCNEKQYEMENEEND